MRFIFLLPIMFVLANCAVSPELSAVRSECYAEARERFPVRIEEYICTRYKTTKWIQAERIVPLMSMKIR